MEGYKMVIPTVDTLNNDPWLLSLSEAARKELLASTIIKRFDANHVLFRRNDEPCYLYCILSGRIRSQASTISGNELMFTSLLAGEWFGEISILDGLGRTHDAVTVEDSVLAMIPKDVVIRLSQRDVTIYQALVALLCDHCRQAFDMIDYFLLFNPEQRLAVRLLKIHENVDPSSEIKINQDELSKLVGISRQSINKILKKWETDGWIRLAYSSVLIEKEAQLYDLIQC